MKPCDEIEKVIGDIALLEGISTAQRRNLARHCHIRTTCRGEAVFLEGERPRALYYLLSGQIKRSVCSQDGSEKVLEVHSSGEFFGEAELFSQRLYEVRAESTAPSELLQIGHAPVSDLLRQCPGIGFRMLQVVSLRHHELEHAVVSRRFQGTNERVLEYLCKLAGHKPEHGCITLSLDIPKQILASQLDMTPETLSRTLRRLSDDGLLSVRGRQVTLNLRAISRYGEATSPEPRLVASAQIRAGRSLRESARAAAACPRPAYL